MRGLPLSALFVALAGACAGSPLDPPAPREDAGPTEDAGDAPADAAQLDGGNAAVGAPDGGAPDAAPAADAGATALSPSGCIDDVTPGQHVFSCDGLAFRVSQPAACAQSGCGLIFDVHGLSMSGPMQENNTNLAALTQNLDYVVVQPSATPAPPLSSWSQRVDDPKIFAVLELALDVFAIDAGRVHFTGFSQGGWMTWRFLCEHANLFASVAPAAASDYCASAGMDGCNFAGATPRVQIPILYMHGTRDALVDITCGREQIDAVIAAWGFADATVVAGDADYQHTRYTNAGGMIFETIIHDYASSASSSIPLVPDIVGHCYPGSADPGDERGQLYSFKCDGAPAFHWGETVLDFFMRTARR